MHSVSWSVLGPLVYEMSTVLAGESNVDLRGLIVLILGTARP